MGLLVGAFSLALRNGVSHRGLLGGHYRSSNIFSGCYSATLAVVVSYCVSHIRCLYRNAFARAGVLRYEGNAARPNCTVGSRHWS